MPSFRPHSPQALAAGERRCWGGFHRIGSFVWGGAVCNRGKRGGLLAGLTAASTHGCLPPPAHLARGGAALQEGRTPAHNVLPGDAAAVHQRLPAPRHLCVYLWPAPAVHLWVQCRGEGAGQHGGVCTPLCMNLALL